MKAQVHLLHPSHTADKLVKEILPGNENHSIIITNTSLSFFLYYYFFRTSLKTTTGDGIILVKPYCHDYFSQDRQINALLYLLNPGKLIIIKSD